MFGRMRFLLIVFTICLSLTITGCGLQDLFGKNKAADTDKETQKQTISVILNEDDPNKALILKGIEDMAKKDEVNIKYLSQPGTEKADSSAQGNKLDGNQSNGKSSDSDQLQGSKALIYQGGNPSVLQKAQGNKIPILALGLVPEGTKPDGIVLSDQEQTGELMAQTLTGKLSEGQVIILEGDTNNPNSEKMTAGIRTVLSKYPKITIQTISGSSESAAGKTFTEYLHKNPGNVQAVLAQTEKLTTQAYEILKSIKAERKVILIGGQASIQSMQRMAKGEQLGDIDTLPYLQGVNAYQWAQKLLKKEALDVNASVTGDQGELPAKVIPVKIINNENLNIIQKNYTKAISLAEQEKQTEQNSANQAGTNKGTSDSEQNKENQKSQNSESNQQTEDSSGSASIPSGVSKITEKIRTETIREYHDSQGKVIGTERSTNEEIKTIPPEMINQENQIQKKSSQQNDQKDKKDQDSQSNQGK
ncbi:MAG: substrate-binding domain-containing protein [Desulfitobacteriaceae bacterium]|nr:substrate-binding domain-containing protein [Desulfitobacteriaceae bacterium]MDD4345630.1 substrate-binding domain-containing protein [Desulfitobacteriaceae bacterium]MDD4400447.1 substrate-binding domain-containing protein [Desulfitobacteriaceae bacterium]